MCKGITLSHHKTTKRQVEVKVLFLLCFYILIWTDIFVVITATLVDREEYKKTLTEYFACEAVATGNCSKDVFDKFDIGSKTLAYFLVALYPAIFLIYFVGVKKCKPKHTQSNNVNTASTSCNS